MASGAISTLGTVAGAALRREAGIDTAARTGPTIVVHRRYTPEGITQNNIVPGLFGMILQLTMVMMTAIALTREIERGTMENLLSMPATPLEIMLGKIVPYLAVEAVQVAVVLLAARVVFAIPFLGHLTLILLGGAGFCICTGHPWLPDFDRRPDPDAGDAADVLFLSAVADAAGLYVSVPWHAILGAIPG